MKKLKQASIERLVLAYKKHLQNLRDEFDIDDLYGDEEITINDFEEVEELKPFRWYPREMFDGNPKGYWTVKRSTCYEVADTEIDTTPIHQLEEGWNYFMYIKPLEVEDED